MKAVRTAFAYLSRSKHYCISAQTYADDVDIVATLDKCSLEPEEWSFMIMVDDSTPIMQATQRSKTADDPRMDSSSSSMEPL